jgi:hypothetical protein
MPYDGLNKENIGEIMNIGLQKTALILPDGIVSNGVSSSWDWLLSDWNDHLKIIAKIETGKNNAEQCEESSRGFPCWGYQSTYNFSNKQDVLFNDIAVRISGTKVQNGELVSVDELIWLKFVEGEYLVSTEVDQK